MSSIQSKLVNLSGNITGTLPIANGGTSQVTAAAAFNTLSPVTTTGDLIYSSSGTTNSRLPIGTTSAKILGVSGGVPAWTQAITGAADTVQLTILGNATQTNNILAVQKSDATELLDVTNVNGTKIRGTTTNDAAAAGFVGEELISTVSRSLTGLTSGSAFDITSMTITPGDWELFPQFSLSSADAITTTKIISWVSTTTAALPANTTWQNISFLKLSGISFANDDVVLALAPSRISVSTNTTYYFSCAVTWTGVGNQGAWGRFAARRLR